MGGQITRILERVRAEKPGAEEELLEVVYGRLRELADLQMRRERPGHTLQPTALVHETYLQLFGGHDASYEDRVHLFAAAAKIMRHILVDFARRRSAGKRGAGRARVTWSEGLRVWEPSPEEIVALHEALERLDEVDPRMTRIVELRFFSGLTAEEAAAAMGISRRSAFGLWEHARAWLYREVGA
jgi:RNA polymerase sigma factor (TIGR02999 family)